MPSSDSETGWLSLSEMTKTDEQSLVDNEENGADNNGPYPQYLSTETPVNESGKHVVNHLNKQVYHLKFTVNEIINLFVKYNE